MASHVSENEKCFVGEKKMCVSKSSCAYLYFFDFLILLLAFDYKISAGYEMNKR
jgi:hypothetical protein